MGAENGQQRRHGEQGVEQRQSAATARALQQRRPQPGRSDHGAAEHDIESDDDLGAEPLLAQERHDEGHVADVAEAEQEIREQAGADAAPFEWRRDALCARLGADRSCRQCGDAGGRERERAEAEPGRLPCVRHGASRERRNEQGRGDDAQARAAVVDAEQQAGTRVTAARRCRGDRRRHQARGEQAARDEGGGAADPGHEAQGVKRRRANDDAVQDKDETGQDSPADEQRARARALEQARHEQGADQVAGGVDGVHGAGGQIAPAEVGAHRRQEQGVGKAGEAERDGRAEGERGRDGDRRRGLGLVHSSRAASKLSATSTKPRPRSCSVMNAGHRFSRSAKSARLATPTESEKFANISSSLLESPT